MALISCSECGHSISERAVACPHCGAPAAGGVVPAGPYGFYSGYEYKSKKRFLGLPLVHVATGWDPATRQRRIAKGIVAVGDIALGFVAVGGLAIGGIAVGGAALGGVALGGAALALLLAVGGLAVGGVAIGGLAIGYFALGGGAFGAHPVGGNFQDPEGVEFFRRWFGSFSGAGGRALNARWPRLQGAGAIGTSGPERLAPLVTGGSACNHLGRSVPVAAADFHQFGVLVVGVADLLFQREQLAFETARDRFVLGPPVDVGHLVRVFAQVVEFPAGLRGAGDSARGVERQPVEEDELVVARANAVVRRVVVVRHVHPVAVVGRRAPVGRRGALEDGLEAATLHRVGNCGRS